MSIIASPSSSGTLHSFVSIVSPPELGSCYQHCASDFPILKKKCFLMALFSSTLLSTTFSYTFLITTSYKLILLSLENALSNTN